MECPPRPLGAGAFFDRFGTTAYEQPRSIALSGSSIVMSPCRAMRGRSASMAVRREDFKRAGTSSYERLNNERITGIIKPGGGRAPPDRQTFPPPDFPE